MIHSGQRHLLRTVMALGMGAMVGCVAGCVKPWVQPVSTKSASSASHASSTPEPAPTTKHSGAFYPIGVRYFIEPQQPVDDERLLKIASEDFGRFRQWGFNCVLIEQAPDRTLQKLMREASNQRLRVLLTTRVMFHYIHFGELPAKVSTVNEFVADYVETFAQRSNVVMHVLPASTSPVAAERRATVERILHQLDPDRPVITIGGARPMQFADRSARLTAYRPQGAEAAPTTQSADASHPPWLIKYVNELRRQADAVPLGRRYLLLPTTIPWPEGQELNPDWWRLIYHECVAAGWTDGVIFERYRSTPTGRGGLLDVERSVTAGRSAVIKRLTAGMRKWGDRLKGMRVVARTAADDPSPIHSAYFARGQRRLLLVYNRRHEIFSSGDTPVLDRVENRAVTRAIDIETGKRYFHKGASMEIPVRLKPAGAKFFELF